MPDHAISVVRPRAAVVAMPPAIAQSKVSRGDCGSMATVAESQGELVEKMATPIVESAPISSGGLPEEATPAASQGELAEKMTTPTLESAPMSSGGSLEDDCQQINRPHESLLSSGDHIIILESAPSAIAAGNERESAVGTCIAAEAGPGSSHQDCAGGGVGEEVLQGGNVLGAPDDEDADEESGDGHFAWMDSADEGLASNSGGEECGKAVPSLNAREVETLSQMLKLAEVLKGRKDLTPTSLVDICGASARVRFYDPSLFQETLGPLLLSYLQEGIVDGCEQRFGIDQALDVLVALAKLNAASALHGVFLAGAKVLRECGEKLSSVQRKVVKEVYASAGRERDVSFLSYLVPCPEGEQSSKIRGSTDEGLTSAGLPMRPGARICDLYSRSGMCNAGISCRMDHPESMRVVPNSEGYPMRPWVQICTYYVRMGTCDYKKTCKWHHPEKKRSL